MCFNNNTRTKMVLEDVPVAALVPKIPRPRPAPDHVRPALDPGLPTYVPGPPLPGGRVRGVHSDRTVGVLPRWIEGFRRHYPQVEFETCVVSSVLGGPALADGAADFALIGREMLPGEEAPYVARFGSRPRRFGVIGGNYRTFGTTHAAVFLVNRDNPLDSLSLAQLDAMYSRTRNRGLGEITRWGQLGLAGEWADRPIRLWGQTVPEGFENLIRERVLLGGEWRDGIRTHDMVPPIPDEVAADRFAIGYAGAANLTEGVKALALAGEPGQPPVPCTFEEVASQRYPLSRQLYLYPRRPPSEPLDPVLREFVRYALSADGQRAVLDDGIFFPLPARVAERERARVPAA